MEGTLGNGTTRNWLELPDHIMELIIKKLDFIGDYVRLGAVCQSWSSLCRGNRHLLPRQLPLLVIPSGDNNVHGLFSFDMKRSYNFSIVIPQDHHCVGSSEGWLVIQAYNCSSLYLFRPLSSANNRIDLPLLPAKYVILKIVLSADPVSTADFALMAILARRDSTGDLLAFCRSGDSTWTKINLVQMIGHEPLNIGNLLVQDAIYHKGQFYVVDGWGNVYTFGFSAAIPLLTQVVQNLVPDPTYRFRYLVESEGDLLQVHRLIDLCPNSGLCGTVDNPYRSSTNGFRILKLDVNSSEWYEVKSLGENILFIGSSSSMSITSSPFSDCVSNYICFYQNIVQVYGGHTLSDSGFFNLEDGSFERILNPHEQSLLLIEPKLGGL